MIRDQNCCSMVYNSLKKKQQQKTSKTEAIMLCNIETEVKINSGLEQFQVKLESLKLNSLTN